MFTTDDILDNLKAISFTDRNGTDVVDLKPTIQFVEHTRPYIELGILVMKNQIVDWKCKKFTEKATDLIIEIKAMEAI